MRNGLFYSRILASAQAGLIAILLFTCCKRVERGTPQFVLDTVEQVRERFCPDRRLAVFDITTDVRGANLRLTGEVTNAAAKQALMKAMRSVARDYKIEEEIVVLPDAELGEKRYGIVNVSVANLRAAPRHGAELVNQMLLGSNVSLLKQRGNWLYGQVDDGYIGWLTAGSIVRADSLALAAFQKAGLVRYIGWVGKIRSKPDDNAMPVSEITLGGVVQRKEEQKENAEKIGWTMVSLPDGREGFLPTHFLSSSAPSPAVAGAGARIIATAEKFLGVPYLWGGASVHGFDCSGFTQIVFAQNGIPLLRDAGQQAREGEAVELDKAFANLRAGDLLFFGDSPEKIAHVAISLSGPRFIHASDYVRINSLAPDDPDYEESRARTLRLARRYFKEPVPISGRGKF
jgi:hypothetical protein